jgi:uncharacterized membrane protein YdjX (TVP38/TMEM64 family)
MSTREQPPAATQEDRPRSARSRWLVAALLLAAVTGFYALGLHRYLSWDYIRGHLDLIQAEVAEHLVLGLVLFVLVYVVVTALSLPAATVLSLLAGALFGRWVGTAATSIAATLGATLAFLSSRYLFRDLVQRRFGARLARINEGVEKEGAYYLFTLRLAPIFPFFLVNLGMGLTPIRVTTYVWVSLLGMLPGTFLYVNAGRELGRLESPKGIFSLPLIVSFALLGLLPLVFRKLIDWRIRRRMAPFFLAGLLFLAASAAGVALKAALPLECWWCGQGVQR